MFFWEAVQLIAVVTCVGVGGGGVGSFEEEMMTKYLCFMKLETLVFWEFSI